MSLFLIETELNHCYRLLLLLLLYNTPSAGDAAFRDHRVDVVLNTDRRFNSDQLSYCEHRNTQNGERKFNISW